MTRILIVDDEKSIRRTLGEFLRAEGYAVVEAEDADAAQQRLREAEFDVVVSDIILPRVTGVELLRRIQDIAPHVQVVMMTGEPTVGTATESLRAGAVDYLFKPISKAAILRAAANAARIKGLEDTRRRLEAENQAHRENLERLVAERTAQLGASEERARDLARFNQGALDALTAHLCVLAEDGTILAVNRAWKEFAAANPPATAPIDVGANYMTVCKSVTGEDQATAQAVIRGLQAVGRREMEEFMLEYSCNAPTQPRWFMLRATRFASGGPVRIVVAHSNITARKRAERVTACFAQLGRELSSTSEATQAARIVTSAAQELLGWDSGFLELRSEDLQRMEHALHWDTVAGKQVEVPSVNVVSDPTPAEQRVRSEGAFLLLREPGEPPTIPTLPFGDATRRSESLLYVPLRYQDRYLGVFSIQSYQPHAYTQTDLVLLQALADHCAGALERIRAEARLRKLARAVEQSPVSIVITDRAGTIEFVNPKFTQVTGYTAEEVLGKNPRLLKSGETAADEYRHLWKTILAGKEWRGEFRNRRKDGALFWEAASISPVRDAAGEIMHFIAVKEDVTEKKLTEAKLLRAQRVESIGSLASGIAHDLNNILTPIVMCAPLLQLEETPEGRRELAQTLESSAHRAVGIVKQLLSFARGKEGQKTVVQVRHLVRDVVKIAREVFPRSIQVEESCAPDLWPVMADATQLHQVLLNLCVNARDAMPAGGTLSLRADNVTLDDHFVSMYKEASPGPFVRIQVEDTGTGIPDEVRDRIFESFFTTKGEGQGTGLGLTTLQGIVRNHKGFVSFTSAPGKGTTFVVHLPAAPEAQAQVETAQSRDRIPRGAGELVLVVDDEPSICETTRRTLERQGYAVLQAHDGIEALAQFSPHQAEVRVVVTDFMMPLMDGVKLCRALRALSPRIPIIVSSGGLFGKPGGDVLHAFEELGVHNILYKPHNAEVLLRTLDQVLHHSNAGSDEKDGA